MNVFIVIFFVVGGLSIAFAIGTAGSDEQKGRHVALVAAIVAVACFLGAIATKYVFMT
jgi:hypothetical protein